MKQLNIANRIYNALPWWCHIHPAFSPLLMVFAFLCFFATGGLASGGDSPQILALYLTMTLVFFVYSLLLLFVKLDHKNAAAQRPVN